MWISNWNKRIYLSLSISIFVCHSCLLLHAHIQNRFSQFSLFASRLIARQSAATSTERYFSARSTETGSDFAILTKKATHKTGEEAGVKTDQTWPKSDCAIRLIKKATGKSAIPRWGGGTEGVVDIERSMHTFSIKFEQISEISTNGSRI